MFIQFEKNLAILEIRTQFDTRISNCYDFSLNFSSDSIIRIYDRRFLALVDFTVPGSPSDRHTVPVKAFTIPSYEKRPFRVTSVNFSQDESELLVSYSSEHLYLFDVKKDVSHWILNLVKNPIKILFILS